MCLDILMVRSEQGYSKQDKQPVFIRLTKKK